MIKKNKSGKAPRSYRVSDRPEIIRALALESGILEEATEALRRKGYFDPPPRPWKVGCSDRGAGRSSYAVLDRYGHVVVETGDCLETAKLIVVAVASYHKRRSRAKHRNSSL